MTLGTLITLSSSHWLGVWLGFEINLMGFTPLLLEHSSRRSEGAVKYLLVQASGSGLLLITRIFLWFDTGFMFIALRVPSRNLLFIASLLLKIGLFPFYFWVPSVINRTSWTRCLILLTWQKIAALGLLSHLKLEWNQAQWLLTCCVIRILIGGLLGINQTQLRRLMAYSSIAHRGWIVILTSLSIRATKAYFILYRLILCGLLWPLGKLSQRTLPQRKRLETKRRLDHITVGVRLLSLGGIPPLMGFFAKVIAIQQILRTSITWVLVFALMGALLNLSYYLTLLFITFISYSPLGLLSLKTSFRRSLFLFLNTIGLIIIPLALSLL